MSESLGYQVPLPPGRNLRFQNLPNGLRISRDVVSRFALWREVVAPAVFIAFFVATTIYFTQWLFLHTYVSGPLAFVTYSIGLIAEPFITLRLIRDTWQNAGIITEVSISGDIFYWQKQTLWGMSERFWPLETIRNFEHSQYMLKVRRHRGLPLGAFAYLNRQELANAASQLNESLDTCRRGKSDEEQSGLQLDRQGKEAG